jgi:hypothetical protein
VKEAGRHKNLFKKEFEPSNSDAGRLLMVY